MAEYGTIGGSSLSRPATIPARSDAVLVTGTVDDDAGLDSEVTKVIKNRTEYDAANRKTSVIENYVDNGTDPDQNRTRTGPPRTFTQSRSLWRTQATLALWNRDQQTLHRGSTSSHPTSP